MKHTSKKLKVVDLFAGIGGIRLAFGENGYDYVYSNDNDPYAAQTYRLNFGNIDCADILKVNDDDIPKCDLILAGFPCQAFSIAGLKRGFDDKRGEMFFRLERILRAKKPRAFLFENVNYLPRHNGGKTFELILDTLQNKLGYDVHWKVLNARNFGIPQNRERVYIVGFDRVTNFEFPNPSRQVTLNDFLERNIPLNRYISQKYFEGLERHRQHHESKGQGFGYKIIDRNGCANTIVVGRMGLERNLVKDRPRMVWKTGYDKSKYKNTKGLRRLTVRECARLQGFRESFRFPVSATQAYKQLGNTVAVPVVRAIAKRMEQFIF